MNDNRSRTAPGPLQASRASRRSLVRLLGGGVLGVLGWNAARDTNASPRGQERGRGATKRIAPPQQPVACDAASTSGIAGLVTIGPMCPVVTLDDPCPDQPFAATLVIRDAVGHELCATQSGEDGWFQVGLPPGWYELAPVSGAAGLPYATSQSVLVAPDQYTQVTVSYDSGIR